MALNPLGRVLSGDGGDRDHGGDDHDNGHHDNDRRSARGRRDELRKGPRRPPSRPGHGDGSSSIRLVPRQEPRRKRENGVERCKVPAKSRTQTVETFVIPATIIAPLTA
jgi:hypothetical protein